MCFINVYVYVYRKTWGFWGLGIADHERRGFKRPQRLGVFAIFLGFLGVIFGVFLGLISKIILCQAKNHGLSIQRLPDDVAHDPLVIDCLSVLVI
jgi:uncharacterized BrkB/YihY/UPF0761 family membrane protein